MAQARAALEAAEASPAAARQVPEKPLADKIQDFVRSAHDRRESIVVFAGTVVSPIPHLSPGQVCVIKEMPSFRVEFKVEQVLQGTLGENATVVFEGCELPAGSHYDTGDHLVVFAEMVNGGEIEGRLLAPGDRIAEAKTALSAALK
jgi:hypothetical protein